MIASNPCLPSRFTGYFLALLLVCVAVVTAQRSSAPPPDGAALFERSCRSCHNGDDPRAPAPDAMAGRSPQAIVDALTSGSMRYQGLALSGAERRAVAEFLTGRSLRGTVVGATAGRCARVPPLTDPAAAPVGTGGRRREEHAFPAAAIKPASPPIRCRGFACSGRSAFLTRHRRGRSRRSPADGCSSAVRTAPSTRSMPERAASPGRSKRIPACARRSPSVLGPQARARRRPRAQTKRRRTSPISRATSTRVDASSGPLLWSRKVDEHPLVRLTGSPTLHAGRLYVPTSSYEEGGRPPGYHAARFAAASSRSTRATGDEVWKSYTIPDPPTLLRTYADGTRGVGSVGRRHLVGADDRREARRIYVGVGNATAARRSRRPMRLSRSI